MLCIVAKKGWMMVVRQEAATAQEPPGLSYVQQTCPCLYMLLLVSPFTDRPGSGGSS